LFVAVGHAVNPNHRVLLDQLEASCMGLLAPAAARQHVACHWVLCWAASLHPLNGQHSSGPALILSGCAALVQSESCRQAAVWVCFCCLQQYIELQFFRAWLWPLFFVDVWLMF
jgi:hypothetical protein